MEILRKQRHSNWNSTTSSLKAFGLFLNWLYTKRIVDQSGMFPVFEDLADLWIFADRVLVPKLQDQILLALNQVRLGELLLVNCTYKAGPSIEYTRRLLPPAHYAYI